MTSSLRNWVKLNPLARYALAGVLGIVLTDYGFTDVPGRDGALLAWMVMALLTFLFSKWIPRELTVFFVFVWLQHRRTPRPPHRHPASSQQRRGSAFRDRPLDPRSRPPRGHAIRRIFEAHAH